MKYIKCILICIDNTFLGKNMIGSFHSPSQVIIDVKTLSTLPDREYISGISEVIKHSIITDKSLFEWLEENRDKIKLRDWNTLIQLIKHSLQIKANIVNVDEKETLNIRAKLNFGHTFGHAIENGMEYGTWLHGEAVATGTMLAANLSARLGLISPDIVKRIERLLKDIGLPTTLNNRYAKEAIGDKAYTELLKKISSNKFYELMKFDKKTNNGKLNLVLLEDDLGCSIITDSYDEADLIKMLDEMIYNS